MNAGERLQIPEWPPRDAEIGALLQAAWESGAWGKYEGAYCDQLVAALQEIHGIAHAFPCCSGTVAVELALRGLKIGAGDEVILAGYDFPGNFRAIEAVGAKPVLVDVAPGSWGMDLAQLSQAVSPSVKAILVSHLHGTLVDMRAVCEWGKSQQIATIEDACQVPGAMVQGKIAGSWGDCGILSFGGSKLLTAGRGGAVLTNQEEIQQRIKLYCDRGNHAFPLSQLQSLVLLPQLRKLAELNQTRMRNVAILLKRLKRYEELLSPPRWNADDLPSFYKLGFLWQGSQFSRDEMVVRFAAKGIPLDSGFRGFVKRPARRCRTAMSLEQATIAAERTLLLHHPILLADEATVEELAQRIGEVLEESQLS